MTYIRAQIAGWHSADPSLDKITNTVYFNDHGALTDWQGNADDILAAYLVGQGFYMLSVNTVEVRLYDLEDDEPRQPKAIAKATGLAGGGAGPREVALCLSFASDTPSGQPPARRRGRIYLGPFSQANLNERPAQSLRETCLALADRLANIGGVDVDWSVFSPTTLALAQGDYDLAFFPVKRSWVDDAWDTQRSRGLPPTVRTEDTHDE